MVVNFLTVAEIFYFNNLDDFGKQLLTTQKYYIYI